MRSSLTKSTSSETLDSLGSFTAAEKDCKQDSLQERSKTLGELKENDPRFTLTPEEREEVIILKDRCDRENIRYRSVFELAKYCLVCSSIGNTQKRRDEAFSRIKKLRFFETKHQLEEVNLMEAVETLEEHMPQWAVACGKIDQKWCVGYGSGSVNPSFMNKNFRTICKVSACENQREDFVSICSAPHRSMCLGGDEPV